MRCHKIQFFKIGKKILHPQRRAFADRYGLRGLIMRIAERRCRTIPLGKCGKVGNHLQKRVPNELQRGAVEDQVGIIRNIAACRTEMNDARRFGRGNAVGVYVRHHVMPHFFFPLGGKRKVDGIHIGFQRRHLFRRNGKSEIMLGTRQLRP